MRDSFANASPSRPGSNIHTPRKAAPRPRSMHRATLLAPAELALALVPGNPTDLYACEIPSRMLVRHGPAPTSTRHAKQLRDPAPCTALHCKRLRKRPWKRLAPAELALALVPGNPTDLYACEIPSRMLVRHGPAPTSTRHAKQLRDPAPCTAAIPGWPT